jgi:small multidrug resistance pump
MAYAFLIFAILLNGCANLLLKMGVARLGEPSDSSLLLRAMENPALLLGLCLFAANVLCYVAALSQLKLSVAYPVMVAGSLLVVVLSSAMWLGESLGSGQWVGIALLLVGIVLVAGRSPA